MEDQVAMTWKLVAAIGIFTAGWIIGAAVGGIVYRAAVPAQVELIP